MNNTQRTPSAYCFSFKSSACLIALAMLLFNGCTNNQSTLLYRLPYANGDDVRVWQDHLTHSGNPTHFVANCQNRKILETVHDVAEIVIKKAPNLSDENVACNGNQVPDAFAKWEICEVSPFQAP